MLNDWQRWLNNSTEEYHEEFTDFLIIEATGWEWATVRRTPRYVRQMIRDMYLIRRKVDHG